MTQRQWQALVRKWSRRLNAPTVPRAVIDDGPEMAEKWAEISFDDSRQHPWEIRFRADTPRPDEHVVHELLHMLTGKFDAEDEPWIDHLAKAITARCAAYK